MQGHSQSLACGEIVFEHDGSGRSGRIAQTWAPSSLCDLHESQLGFARNIQLKMMDL